MKTGKEKELTSQQRSVALERIGKYIGQMVGLARYHNHITGEAMFTASTNAEKMLDFFLLNPIEIGLPGDVREATRIEQEDRAFCRTMTSGERHVLLMEVVIQADLFVRELTERGIQFGGLPTNEV